MDLETSRELSLNKAALNLPPKDNVYYRLFIQFQMTKLKCQTNAKDQNLKLGASVEKDLTLNSFGFDLVLGF